MRNKKDSIPLKSIQWKATLEGPVLSYRSVQHYENTTDETIEISYSFPLPYGKAVITKFSAEINGVIREAKALPKHEAEEKYEDAMEEGDSPIMLKIQDKDFCTASLGNLKKGEKAKIVVEYLQFVYFNENNTRIKIPTVLDERFASDPEELPDEMSGCVPNIFADYAYTGELIIKNARDMAAVSSPTHSIKVSIEGADIKVETVGGKANSDIVIDVETKSAGMLCLAKDGQQWAALASLLPRVDVAEDSLDLSILLDCSGSMTGSRIRWAKNTLAFLAQNFKRKDKVSLYCFGSSVQIKKLPNRVNWPGCNPLVTRRLHRDWEDVIEEISADLGGTELAEALKVCGESFPGTSDKSAILLITDGEVWDKESVLKASRLTGRRIFVIGIGMAPYGNLLTSIASGTGGYYDSVYCQSDVEGAAHRVINRLRSPVIKNPRVLWPSNTIWQSKQDKSIFAADSYNCAAFLNGPIDSVELDFKVNGENQKISIHRLEKDFGDAFVKLVANIRMVESRNPDEQRQLGLKYNLAGPETNFLLVIERAEEDKPEDIAKLSVVPQMVVKDNYWMNNTLCYRMASPAASGEMLCRKASRAAKPQRMFNKSVKPDLYSDSISAQHLSSDQYDDSVEDNVIEEKPASPIVLKQLLPEAKEYLEWPGDCNSVSIGKIDNALVDFFDIYTCQDPSVFREKVLARAKEEGSRNKELIEIINIFEELADRSRKLIASLISHFPEELVDDESYFNSRMATYVEILKDNDLKDVLGVLCKDKEFEEVLKNMGKALDVDPATIMLSFYIDTTLALKRYGL